MRPDSRTPARLAQAINAIAASDNGRMNRCSGGNAVVSAATPLVTLTATVST
jgi:hypothetical protein